MSEWVVKVYNSRLKMSMRFCVECNNLLYPRENRYVIWPKLSSIGVFIYSFDNI